MWQLSYAADADAWKKKKHCYLFLAEPKNNTNAVIAPWGHHAKRGESSVRALVCHVGIYDTGTASLS